MKENILIENSKKFAVEVINLCENIKGKATIVNQLVRSGTSIGANIREANYAHGKADFIAKLQIALKEANETGYWLELLLKTSYMTKVEFDKLEKEQMKLQHMAVEKKSPYELTIAREICREMTTLLRWF